MGQVQWCTADKPLSLLDLMPTCNRRLRSVDLTPLTSLNGDASHLPLVRTSYRAGSLLQGTADFLTLAPAKCFITRHFMQNLNYIPQIWIPSLVRRRYPSLSPPERRHIIFPSILIALLSTSKHNLKSFLEFLHRCRSCCAKGRR